MRICLTLLIVLLATDAAAQATRSTEQIGDESFEVWHRAGDDFRMYCREPCAADDQSIRAFYNRFGTHLPALIEWHGVDVIEELKPVEIHLNESSICPPLSGAAGYARIGTHRGWEMRRGLNCLFEVERGADTLAERNPVLALHEYAHLILFERHRWSYEYFTYWSSWAVWDPENDFADPCSDFYENFYATGTVHALCESFGLKARHVRDALVELDRRFRNEEGFLAWQSEFGHTTTVAELRGLLDTLLEADTAAAWLIDGWSAINIGVDFSLGGEAARYEAVEGRIVIDAPADALPAARPMRLDSPNSTTGFIPFTHSPRNFAIVEAGTSSFPYAEQTDFARPVSLSLQPEPFYLNAQPLDTYTIVEQRLSGSGQPYWRPVENQSFDPETGMLSASIARTGHYAYGPAFKAPAGMFYDPRFGGHGFDIQMSGDSAFVVFYTYELDGDPIWLIGNGALGNVPGKSQSAVEMALSRVERDPQDGSLSVTDAGRLFLQFYASASQRGWDIRANAEVEIRGITGQPVAMALQQLDFGESRDTELQVTGHWYDPGDPGWGLTIDRKGSIESAVAYFYDADGHPRWAIGARDTGDPFTELTTVRGYCLACEVVERQIESAGTLTPTFDASERGGRATLDVAWPADASSRWQRANATIAPLSDPPVYRIDPNNPTLAGSAASEPASNSSSSDLNAGKPDARAPFHCAMPHGPGTHTGLSGWP